MSLTEKLRKAGKILLYSIAAKEESGVKCSMLLRLNF